jgi:hypothetical protein
MNCVLSWTRSGTNGGKLTICLLDREPVLDDMTDCDRYEAKPDKIGGPPAPSLLSAGTGNQHSGRGKTIAKPDYFRHSIR